MTKTKKKVVKAWLVVINKFSSVAVYSPFRTRKDAQDWIEKKYVDAKVIPAEIHYKIND